MDESKLGRCRAFYGERGGKTHQRFTYIGEDE